MHRTKSNIGVAIASRHRCRERGGRHGVYWTGTLASIVAAIEEGRSIYSNIQKYLRYLLATNLGE